jgi:hypothetical protein
MCQYFDFLIFFFWTVFCLCFFFFVVYLLNLKYLGEAGVFRKCVELCDETCRLRCFCSER